MSNSVQVSLTQQQLDKIQDLVNYKEEKWREDFDKFFQDSMQSLWSFPVMPVPDPELNDLTDLLLLGKHGSVFNINYRTLKLLIDHEILEAP